MGLDFTGEKKHIKVGESHELVPLGSIAPGTYLYKIDCPGTNTILSTLYYKSGAGTINASWFEYTTDGDDGEEYQLGSHQLLTAAGIDRKSFTDIHKKPVLRLTITGAAVVCSVFVSSQNRSLSTPSSPQGLTTGGKFTAVPITSVGWTALPSAVLAGRNAISIQNLSGQAVYINFNPAAAALTGVVMSDGSERFYDITDTIQIYARSTSGAATLGVEELA